VAVTSHTQPDEHFFESILERPANEKPFIVVPVGYAKERKLMCQLLKGKIWKKIIIKGFKPTRFQSILRG